MKPNDLPKNTHCPKCEKKCNNIEIEMTDNCYSNEGCCVNCFSKQDQLDLEFLNQVKNALKEIYHQRSVKNSAEKIALKNTLDDDKS